MLPLTNPESHAVPRLTGAPALTADCVHLWHLDLAAPPGTEVPADLLTEEEAARAGRMRNEIQRRSFIAVRSALRRLLGHYLQTDPAQVELTAGEHGKPRLAGTEPDRGLVFNVSHSGQKAALAFALDLALGVDLELRRPLLHPAAFARRCLAPSELAAWKSLPDAEQVSRLMDLWVCKEAFGKATGLGIQVGLQAVVVDPERSKALHIPSRYGPVEDWQLRRLRLGDDYAGCVCWRGPAQTLWLADLPSWP